MAHVLAGEAGFEPTHAGVKVPCLTAWRYPIVGNKKEGERWGSNPRHPEPQSGALPLNYSHHDGAPGGARTPDPRLRRPLLYPTELQAHAVVLAINPQDFLLTGIDYSK